MKRTHHNTIARIAAIVAGLGLVALSFASFVPPAHAITITPVNGQNYSLYAGGISSSATSITVTSLVYPATSTPIRTADIGTRMYATLEPGNTTRQEVVSFTGITQNADGTATLTGVTRGLLPYYPYTADSTLRKQHPGGSILVLGNPAQLYNDIITYINDAIFAGAADASTIIKGLVELATQAETAAGTATGGSGPLAVPNSTATSTWNSAALAASRVVVSDTNGKIADGFIATSTILTAANGLFGAFGSGADGDVTISSPTTLTRDMYYNNLVITDVLTTGNYRVFVKGTVSGAGTIQVNPGTTGYFTYVAGSDGGAHAAVGTAGTSSSFAMGSSSPAGTGSGGQSGNGNPGFSSGGAGGAAWPREVGNVAFNTITGMAYASSTGTHRLITTSGGAAGGGGGGDTGANNGGSGGAGGSSGGTVFLAAKYWTGTFTIKALGGAGVAGNNGTNGGSYGGGGGGGGNGGNGGNSITIYASKTWTGTYTLTAGAGGAAGNGGTGGTTAGSAGAAGATGNAGTAWQFDIAHLLH